MEEVPYSEARNDTTYEHASEVVCSRLHRTSPQSQHRADLHSVYKLQF